MTSDPKMPPSPDDVPAFAVWVAGIGVTETAALLDRLHVELGEHQHFALPYEVATAKRYFMSRCLLDVQHMAGAMIRLRHWLTRQEKNSANLDEIMTWSLVTELGGWQRKHHEALTRLILFSTTDTDAHYFHYLLVHDADDARREADSFRSDWDSESECMKRRLEWIETQATALSIALPVWYARPKKDGTFRPVTAAEMTRAALAVATPAEATALGYSYAQGFSAPSQLLHFSTTAPRRPIEQGHLSFACARLQLLSVAITRRVAQLSSLEHIVAPLPPKVRVTNLPEPGDFVVVTLDRENVYLAEVIAWKKQSQALGGVRVRFIDATPYPGVSEDDLPSNLVQPFASMRDLMAEFATGFPELASLPEAERLDACKAGAREAWERAFKAMWLDGLRKRPDA